MIIRNAAEHEYEYIKNLRLQAYQEHAKKIPAGHWEILKNQITSDADLQPSVERIVAELDGLIVGTVALFPTKIVAYKGLVDDESEYPEIRMLAVHPNARGKGIATLLLKECIKRCKQEGYQAIGLHTSDFMSTAVKLYEELGFEWLPQYDFEPADDGIIVKAFRVSLK
jgi:GNAT superfamily N-acetyltransferase